MLKARDTFERWRRSAEGRRAAADLDDATEADRQWFEAHPGESTCIRAASSGELSQQRALDRVQPDATMLITVEQIAPGARFRYSSWVPGELAIDPRLRVTPAEVEGFARESFDSYADVPFICLAALLLEARTGAVCAVTSVQ